MRQKPILLSALGLLAFLALWEAFPKLSLVSTSLLPAPSDLPAAFMREFRTGMWLDMVLLSLDHYVTGFIWGAGLGTIFGILTGMYQTAEWSLAWVVRLLRPIPNLAWAPFAIIWFGVGEETKIFLLWLGTFFQLVLLVADDMRRVPQEFVEVARTVGANSRQVMTDVALRWMGPTLLDNLRITLGWCWTYLIIAEIVAADSGIGYVIWTARRFVKTPEVMAGVVVIGLIGLVTDQLLRLLHRRLFRYL